MVATLVFIAVATGAADDTVDLEIGVAGAYPGQAPITLEAFASRSFGGLGNGNTAIPSASPAVSPATLEEQTAMEDFPNVPEEVCCCAIAHVVFAFLQFGRRIKLRTCLGLIECIYHC